MSAVVQNIWRELGLGTDVVLYGTRPAEIDGMLASHDLLRSIQRSALCKLESSKLEVDCLNTWGNRYASVCGIMGY